MFGIGTTEILIILVVALIVIGPKKLPDVARTLGKALGEFKRMSSDVKRTIDLESERAEETQRTVQAEKELFPPKEATDTSTTADASAASDTDSPVIDVGEQSDATTNDTKEPAASKDMTGKEA